MAMFVVDEPDAKILEGKSDYGDWRPEQRVFHWAIDLTTKNWRSGTVRSPVSGTVVYADKNRGYHPSVLVVRADGELPGGKRAYHIFGHMSKKTLPPVGSRIERGQILGKFASSEEIFRDPQNLSDLQRKMAPHVHWEIAIDDKNPVTGTRPEERVRVDPVTWWATGKLVERRTEKIEVKPGIPPYWAAGAGALALAGAIAAAVLSKK